MGRSITRAPEVASRSRAEEQTHLCEERYRRPRPRRAARRGPARLRNKPTWLAAPDGTRPRDSGGERPEFARVGATGTARAAKPRAPRREPFAIGRLAASNAMRPRCRVVVRPEIDDGDLRAL